MIAKSYRYNEGGTRRPLCVGNACCLDLAQPPSNNKPNSNIKKLLLHDSHLISIQVFAT